MITDELIYRSLRGETAELEERELQLWRAHSEENEARYRQIAKLWDLRHLLEPLLHLDPAPTAQEILSREAGRPSPNPPPVDRPERRRAALPPFHLSRTARLRLAASLVLLPLAAGVVGYMAANGRGAPVRSMELITANAEMSSARLPDGSVVRLAPVSRLEVEITQSSRRAQLQGRAFFAVEHDAARPFTVITGAGEVQVVGTRFDVEADAGGLQVIVVDGAVGVSAGGETVLVEAGQLARVRDGGRPEVEDVDDVYGTTSWIGNFVAFESTPLVDVARELEHRYGMRIEIEDDLLARQTVTSWSLDRSPEEIVAAVCLALNALCAVTDTLTTIGR